jgi:transcription antitermination factor NusG
MKQDSLKTDHSSQIATHCLPITAHSSQNKWFAIYVKSRHEKSVHSEFQQKGIESSLPLITVTRQWSDRRKKVEVPLFRGYVFVNIDISKDKMNVLQTDGVVKFVTFCNKTVSIPSEQMYWLDQLLMSELQVESEQDFPLGGEVDVTFGPLKGLRGRVKQKNSKTRLVVWFDTIMQGVSVEIDTASVSHISHKDKHIQPVQTGGNIM